MISSKSTKAIVKAVYQYYYGDISAVEIGEIADSILYQTLAVDVFEPWWSLLLRMGIIGDEDGGFARIVIRPSFPNLLYRLFADLQMLAHFRILFQPCSSSGIISTAKFFFKSLL